MEGRCLFSYLTIEVLSFFDTGNMELFLYWNWVCKSRWNETFPFCSFLPILLFLPSFELQCTIRTGFHPHLSNSRVCAVPTLELTVIYEKFGDLTESNSFCFRVFPNFCSWNPHVKWKMLFWSLVFLRFHVKLKQLFLLMFKTMALCLLICLLQ